MNLENKIIGNRYQLIKKIGSGGMATVYRAKDLILNRFVAVKILRDEFTTDEEFVKRFNVEAQAAASITHPNIVSVYDVGQDDDLYYIVMELVKGKTLKEIIVEDGALGWKWSVEVSIQIASALETAHRNNIVHRDIKPHNIIITEEGVAKVTDFGIAKAVSNSTITAFGTTIGSVHYFSPEHARGGITDAKSDLYSLGVVMYEMITGRVPFDSDTPVSVALKHIQEDPIEPIILKPNIPKSVNDVIMKAMKKNPDDRYLTATEMIKDLEMSLKGANNTGTTRDVNKEVSTRRMSLDYSNELNTKEKTGKFTKIKDFFKKHPVLKFFSIILLCILIFSIAMGVTYFALTVGKPKEVQIPDLSNLTYEEAQQRVNELKLKLEIKEEKYHLEIEEGKIIEQEPKYQENYNVKEGSVIKVVVSKGQEIVKVPKVEGMIRDDGIKALRDIGLEVKVKEENNDKIEKDIIIKKGTEDGKELADEEEIPAGTTVVVYVSMGIEQVPVPDLSGKTEEEAKTAISNAKLKWKGTEKIADASKPNGVVVNQSVSSGSMVNKNTEIGITVNEFNEIKDGKIIVNVSKMLSYNNLNPDGTEKEPQTVQVTLSLNNEEYATKTVAEDNTNLEFVVSSTGSKTAKIQIKSQSGKVLTTNEFTFNSGEEKSV